MTLPPASVTSLAVAPQSLMSPTTILAPSVARCRANSWPRPRAAPVIAIVLPATLIAAWASNHLVGGRVDQVHMGHVADELHVLARSLGGGRIDPAAALDAVDDEVAHCLHAHRLDHVKLHLERCRAGG